MVYLRFEQSFVPQELPNLDRHSVDITMRPFYIFVGRPNRTKQKEKPFFITEKEIFQLISAYIFLLCKDTLTKPYFHIFQRLSYLSFTIFKAAHSFLFIIIFHIVPKIIKIRCKKINSSTKNVLRYLLLFLLQIKKFSTPDIICFSLILNLTI